MMKLFEEVESEWKGFTSEQRKNVIYGRENHRNGRNKE